MPLGWFRAEQFRCLAEVELTLDPAANLFVGPNASGKTSLLEAAFFLGRGRSFRSRRRDALIRHGQEGFLLAGRTTGDPVPVPLGVRASRSSTEWRAGGAAASGIAELAEQFPAQVIDPEVHKLLEEGAAAAAGFSTGACSTWNHPSWRTGAGITRRSPSSKKVNFPTS